MKLYSYNKCGTCRKAIRFLEDKKVKFDLFDITETPPTKQILKVAMQAKGMKKLFNTSGVRLAVGIEDNKSSNKSFVCVSKPNRFSVTFTGINSVISSKLSPKVIESASNKTCFKWVETSMTG